MEAMMDLREAARGAGGEAKGANARFAAVSSDTRTIGDGALFVALRGERGSRRLGIGEGHALAVPLLVVLVALAGDQHHVAGGGGGDDCGDRFAPVGDDQRRLP